MKKFTYLLRVRYSECDAQKIVFNGKYTEFLDVASTEFIRAIWGDFNEISAIGIDNQVVNLNISWKAPSAFDDVLSISVNASHIGNSSYTLSFNIVNYKTGTEIANAEIVYVMVDATAFTKKSIPEELKQKLQQGAPNLIVNHAGAIL